VNKVTNPLRILGPIGKVLVRNVTRGEGGPSLNDRPSADDVAHGRPKWRRELRKSTVESVNVVLLTCYTVLPDGVEDLKLIV